METLWLLLEKDVYIRFKHPDRGESFVESKSALFPFTPLGAIRFLFRTYGAVKNIVLFFYKALTPTEYIEAKIFISQ